MDAAGLILQIFTAVTGCVVAVMSIPFFFWLYRPAPVLWIIKV